MGFDDFFEHGHKHHKRGYDHHHEHDNYYESSHSNGNNSDLKYQLLNKLRTNPKFRSMFLISVLILLIILIILIILLFPLIVQLFQFLAKNGIQGLIESIWEGSK